MSGIIIATVNGPDFDCAARRDEISLFVERRLDTYVIGSGYDLATGDLELELRVDGDNEDEIAEKLSKFVLKLLGLTVTDISFFED